MKVINLGETNSILNSFVAEIRDKSVQKDSMRFRRNLERIGEIFAYEISKTLTYELKSVRTPLGIAEVSQYKDKIVAATVLRAGLPLHQGILNYFDKAANAFVATYRKDDKDSGFDVSIKYAAVPDIEGKVLIIADSMIATGSSIEITYNELVEEGGEPVHTHIVCPVASAYGIDMLKKRLRGKNVTVWVAAIDPELTNSSYIIPGLGDAGDLAFGEKN